MNWAPVQRCSTGSPSIFRRDVNNYANEDQIYNIPVSFPIAFRKAPIYGAEGKLEVLDCHEFAGFLSYSYEFGNTWFPVTDGLLLGDEAASAATQFRGHFPARRISARRCEAGYAASWLRDFGLRAEYDTGCVKVRGEAPVPRTRRRRLLRRVIEVEGSPSQDIGGSTLPCTHNRLLFQIYIPVLLSGLQLVDVGHCPLDLARESATGGSS